MAPENEEQRRSALSEDEECDDASEQPQYLYLIRHGDRWDYENPSWTKTTSRPGDPPLSTLGHQQARETGVFLEELFRQDGISVENITWLSSPFLRCLQTSNEALNAMSLRSPDARDIRILPEYSVFEWDARGGNWHASLPTLQERAHYFPRLDLRYESLFVPTLPESSRDVFLERCERAASHIRKRFPFRPKTALVVVTHAAACIGIAQAATNLTLADINPAAPCSVYRLTRTNAHQETWTIDACDKTEGLNLNGHTAHVSSMNGKTVAWNNFGPKHIHRGYTGPPSSKFAPPSLRTEV